MAPAPAESVFVTAYAPTTFVVEHPAAPGQSPPGVTVVTAFANEPFPVAGIG